MAHYIFGDIQGCFTVFQQLLNKIRFNSTADQLVFCGDIVNRGGQSLDMLRWVYANQYCCQTVLGNHDLSLLSQYFIPEFRTENPELEEIFAAKDAGLMMSWLLRQPLLIEFKNQIVIHAGVYPLWNLQKLKFLTKQAHKQMNEQPVKFFKQMYGNKPDLWSENLSNQKSNRFIINTVSRMRFLDNKNRLNLTEKGSPINTQKLMPWFKHKKINAFEKHIIFGHWSALGYYQDENVTCLDSGRVWGGKLTALQLETGQLFQV